MRISIEQAVFDLFPTFCRGVVIAQNINNFGPDARLYEELNKVVNLVKSSADLKDLKGHPHIASWRRAFEKFGVNPNASPPSIQNLVKRVGNGATLPFISKIVCLFNIMSLKYVLPLGGDDLKAVIGNLCLGVASGDETYTPLGKPELTEKPKAGEIIYYDIAAKEVLCRAWCWRNSEKTKITAETSVIAINVDGLPPVTAENVLDISNELADKIKTYCGGTTQTYILSKEQPEIYFDVL